MSMYAKLVLRNAKRSAGDYLLYIVTLIVLSALMMFSNLLSMASSQNGLQASSVPLLISLVMLVLLGYINGYMLRRRAKEFAIYILLGMKKGHIGAVFFGESLFLGLIGFVGGVVVGSLLFSLALSVLQSWFPITGNMSVIYAVAAKDSLMYFGGIQVFSLLGCMSKIKKMQISGLLREGRRNQPPPVNPRPVFWSTLCALCVVFDYVFVLLITSGHDLWMMIGVNVIIFPLLLGIWAFYKAAFHWLAWLRVHRRGVLYHGNRLNFACALCSSWFIFPYLLCGKSLKQKRIATHFVL